MKHIDQEYLEDSSDYDVNVRMIAFSVVTIVLILVAIFFIKTYSNQKQSAIHDMHIEWDKLETFCQERLDHTEYILNLLAIQIKENPDDFRYVQDIFECYINSQEMKKLFDIKECFWFHDLLNIKVRSTAKNNKYISQFITNKVEFPEKVTYGISSNDDTIHAIIGVRNESKKYVGSIVVDFDLINFTQNLASRKKHEYTNFALIGEGNKVIIQSNASMSNIGLKDGYVTNKRLKDILDKIGFYEENDKEFSYLDMINGVNYYVKKMHDHPFILLVNIDPKEIKKDIFNKVLMKFMEISLVALGFLLLIITIYRRETWLRSKAERASYIANRATKAKSDFLAFTAHEIRSPLGFIVTGSEVIQKKLLGDFPIVYKEYVDGINTNAHLILDFITDILDETHIMENNFSIINSVCSIKEIINNSIKINQSKLKEKNSKFNIKIDSGLPKLLCDPRRILQVLNNLISNAIKYSFENSTISILAKMENCCLCVYIIDQGIGMNSEEIKIALTKYGTVHNKKNFQFIESYGLGLPIVKMLLDAHDSDLLIESQVNIGTTIKITFPKYKLVYGKKISNLDKENNGQ